MVFLTKLGSMIATTFARILATKVFTYVVGLVKDLMNSLGRKARDEAQKKKDQENLKPYEDAVKNGTKENIIRETENMLNG